MPECGIIRRIMEFHIDIREQDGVRSLRFESECMQGAMRISEPWALTLEYTQVMMAALLLRDADFPRRVLLIGLGAGSLTKFLYRHSPQAHLTVVEIEPRVVAAAREHFALPDDPARLNVVVGDGVAFVRDSDESYDLILVDGFNAHSHPGDLNTRPFYDSCRRRLSEQGVLAVNLIGLSQRYQGGFVHIAAAFDGRAVLFPRCRSGNTIAFAATGNTIQLTLDELQGRARALAAQTGLVLLPVINSLEQESICREGFLGL